MIERDGGVRYDPAVHSEPVDDMVRMTVDHAEQDHRGLRRGGIRWRAP
ncbi:hypothetical protein [Nocardiopsis aegyptia]|uniref:Uncharacterized protein n=1 Tax=Nocardiopsis aegyptia TaxID=220378 RepID=A0A7Z0ESD3_9ACTN|nr:hypothetical protein [Nocardiopsis aegyptia]NYJ37430.1 hypothetical protein [Nocardiopsis aegyptia]